MECCRAGVLPCATRPQDSSKIRLLSTGVAWPAGVDNGQLWFDHVRVPRDALLDAFASVAEDGAYSSAIPSVSQRFGTMVGGLTTGARAPAASCSLATYSVLRGIQASRQQVCMSQETL